MMCILDSPNSLMKFFLEERETLIPNQFHGLPYDEVQPLPCLCHHHLVVGDVVQSLGWTEMRKFLDLAVIKVDDSNHHPINQLDLVVIIILM